MAILFSIRCCNLCFIHLLIGTYKALSLTTTSKPTTFLSPYSLSGSKALSIHQYRLIIGYPAVLQRLVYCHAFMYAFNCVSECRYFEIE